MAVMERLALIIDADGQGAIREMDKVGRAAERDLGKAEDKTDKWAKTFTSAGTKMMAASAVVGVALWNAASATSDLNEAVSQTEQVFGSASTVIGEFAEGAAAIGQSERQAREAANTFGLFFEKANVTNDEAAEMSVTMTELASDMASFKNTSPEQAIEALGSALRGESEPIRAYGVLLDAATLKQRAFDMGLVDSTTATLPPAIKMQAAYAEIIEQTGTIQGDFIRTADGAANSQRVAAAEFENAKAAIGEGFLPVMQSLVGVAGDVASGFAGLNEATGGFVSKLLAVGTVATGAGGAVLFTAGKAIELKKALDASAFAASAFGKKFMAAMGPVAVTAAGLVAIWAALEFQFEQNRQAASETGDEIESAILKADPEKLRRMLAATNDEIAHMKDEMASSSDAAFWDAGFRQGISEMGAELERTGGIIDKFILQSGKMAKATGNTEAETLKWLQTEADAGRVYDSTKDALAEYRRQVELAGGAVDTMTAEELELANQYADSLEQVEELTKAIDDYYKALDAPGDLVAEWEESIDGLSSALEENGLAFDKTNGRFDYTTEAGRANRQAMIDARNAAVDFGQAVIDNGGSLEEAEAATLSHAAALRQQLLDAGLTETAVDSLLTELGLTPETVSTGFSTPGLEAALTGVDDYRSKLDALPIEKQVTVKYNALVDAGIWGFGGPRAAGGPVSAGKTYLVGEQGPELVTMGGSGHVTNARDTAAAMDGGAGGGAQTINLVVDGRTLASVAAPYLAQDRRGRHGSRRTE